MSKRKRYQANGEVQQLTTALQQNGVAVKQPLLPAAKVAHLQPTNGQQDPARLVPGMPPNFGEFAVPHVLTFQGILSTISKVYRPSDEALKASLENARYMRNDPAIMECIEQRQRSLCLLDWHLAPDDEADPVQQQLADELTAIIETIPRFMQYRENLAHATWFGRYAVSHAWGWKKIRGKMRCGIKRWKPVHGDKLVFRFDDGDHHYDDEQIGIRVSTATRPDNLASGRWKIESMDKRKGQGEGQVETTDRGLAYFLRPDERHLLALHKHYIEDGEYEDPINAGRIHGVGLRSRLYWIWVQKQELLSWLMEYLERSAFGLEMWYYPWGNDEARERTLEAAKKRIGDGRNIVLVPKPMGEEGMAYGVERIEPGMAGADIVLKILTEYFGHLIKRHILGQTLTSEAAGTGLGSNLASIHLDTYMQIIRYDATNLDETLTTDLVDPIKALNFPSMADVPIRFVTETEAPDVESKLQAWKTAFDMTLKLRAEDVYNLIGATPPDEGDEVLQQQQPQAPGQPGMPGQEQGGMPPGMPPGQPAQAVPGNPDASEVYSAIESEKDSRKMQGALGIAPGENAERQKIESGSDADPIGWPSDEEQVQSVLPHASGLDPRRLGAALAVELQELNDPKLALQVATAKLEADADHYERYFRAR